MSAGAAPEAAFPVPVPEADTQPFWDACRHGELRIQRCGECGRCLWQPRPICSSCRKSDPVWTAVSGDGAVASWMVMRPPTLPAYADKLSYVILLVELDEGVEIGTRVALRFYDQAGTILLAWTVAP